MTLLETYPTPKKPLLSDTTLIVALWICAALVVVIGTWQSAYAKGTDDKAAELSPVISEQVARADSAEKSAAKYASALADSRADYAKQAAEAKAVREDNEQLAKKLATAHTVAPAPRKSVKRTPAAKATKVAFSGSGVSRWESTVKRYFKGYHADEALRVIAGESRGNPNAKNGPCLGLFQIDGTVHAKKIAEKAKSWGMKPNLYDPVFNIRFAAYMTNGGRDWSNWSVKP